MIIDAMLVWYMLHVMFYFKFGKPLPDHITVPDHLELPPQTPHKQTGSDSDKRAPAADITNILQQALGSGTTAQQSGM